MSNRGQFIVVEGADGVGSTTQSKLLVDFLIKRGVRATYTAEPSGGDVGSFLRDALRSGTRCPDAALALMFAADRLDHYENEIRPLLEDGITVVSDRYLLSSLVYQSLGGLSVDWLSEINRHAPAPDRTFVITLPFEDAWARIQARLSSGTAVEEMFDRRETQAAIHAGYSDLLHKVDGIVIDGSGSPLEVLSRATLRLGFH